MNKEQYSNSLKEIMEKSDNWFFTLSHEKRLYSGISFLKMWALTNKEGHDIQEKDIYKATAFLKRKKLKKQMAIFIGIFDIIASSTLKQHIYESIENKDKIIDFKKQEI